MMDSVCKAILTGFAKLASLPKKRKLLLLAAAALFLRAGAEHGETLFRQGLLPVKIDGKCGYIQRDGLVAIPPQYDDARAFSEVGLAASRRYR